MPSKRRVRAAKVTANSARRGGDDAGRAIERAMRRRAWRQATELIRSELRESPDNHWLWMQLAAVNCLRRPRLYGLARTCAEQALTSMPGCPLALWYHACALSGLGETKRALAVWRRIVRMGLRRIAFGPCGEGMEFARSLAADCRYMLAVEASRSGDKVLARRLFAAFMRARRNGVPTVIAARRIAEMLRELGVSRRGEQPSGR